MTVNFSFFVLFRKVEAHSNNQSGFTLIELLVVVSIIGILAAIAIPQFNLYRARAANATAQSDLRNSISAQEGSFVDSELYTDCTNSGCNDPALPGMTVSPGISIACTSRENAQKYLCSARHSGGTLTYYYDSESSLFWEN